MKKMRKILFLFPHLGMGGIPKALSFVANLCYRNGFQVQCISMKESEKTISLDPNLQVEFLPYDLEETNFLYKIVKQGFYLIKLNRFIINNKIDIVCAFGTDLVRIVTLATNLLNIKIVGSERGNPYAYNEKQRKKYAKAIRKCDAFICQSEGAKKYYDFIEKPDIHIIPNPAIPRLKKIIKHVGKREKTIILCGRLSKEKNYQMALEAFSYLVVRFNDYKMKIYGDGPEYNNINKYIKELRIEENVEIITNCSDVFDKERNASMYVICSKFEGMPNSLIEAMISGIPSIATNCPPGGVDFVTRHGELAMLIPPNNVFELVAAMEKLIENSHLADDYSNKAQEINTFLNAKVIEKEWLKIFEEI